MANNRRSAGQGGFSGWLKGQMAKKPKPIWMLAVADALIFAIALLSFAYFHHVRPREQEAVGITSSRQNIAAPVSQPTADPMLMMQAMPVATPEPEPAAPVGYFGDKFAEFQKISSDNKKREEVRKAAIAGYAKKNGITATMYQDYGWEPVKF